MKLSAISSKTKSLLIGAFLVLSIMSAAALEIYIDYQVTKERAFKAAFDLTLVVESQIRDTLNSTENMIDKFAVGVIKNDLSVIKNNDFTHNFKVACVLVIGCESVAIIDPGGNRVFTTVENTSMVNLSDREFFKEAIAEKKMVVGSAVVARLPNKPIVFNLAKPVFNKDGELIGVVSVSMKTSHLTGFYSLLGFGFSPTVSVYKFNGNLISRTPDIEKYVGNNNKQTQLFDLIKDAPFGIYLSISPFDGLERLAAYRKVEGKDMIIFAGIQESVAFTQWKIRAVRVSLIIGALLILTLFAFYLTYRALLQKEGLQIENDKLDELTNLDQLTAIGNRRLFDNTLKRDWQKYKKTKIDLSILIIDVDFFKPYNDNYGHQEGDRALFKIAQAIKMCVNRPNDLVARYGGEEFIVILNANEKGAIQVAEIIRKKIEDLEIKHEFSPISKTITVSIGITSTTISVAKNAEDLVSEADKALYKAKKNGRNQVVIVK